MRRKNKFAFAIISLILLLCMVVPFGFNFYSNYAQKRYNITSAVNGDGDSSDSGSEISLENEILEEDLDNILNENSQHNLVNNQGQPAQNNNANANQNAKGKMETATKLAIATYAGKTAASVAEMFVDMANKGADQVDYIKHAFSIARNAANLVATIVAGNPAAGVICDTVFQIIDMIGKIGDHSQSELQMMESRLNDQFDIVNENIEDVKNTIINLSNQVEEGFDKILKQLDSSFEAYSAKTKVNDFIYSDTGNFSYNTFRKYLYGEGNLGYYLSLYTSIQNNDAEEIIAEKYNKLYDVLLGNHNGQESCMDLLYENYLVANSTRPTIIKLYYEYMSSNQSYLTETTPTLATIDFAQNVYADYYFASNIIKTIHTYQVTQLVNNALNSGEDISTLRYEYAEGAYNTIADINRINQTIDARLEALDRQLMLDLATVLELDDSYAVQDVNGRYRYEKDKTNANFANLSVGQTLYLNQITDYFAQMFGLNSNKFEYKFVDKNGKTISTEYPGIYVVDGTKTEFSAIITYNNNDIYELNPSNENIYPVYSMNFRVGDNTTYAGGLGTNEYPYIISSAEQFGLLYQDENLNKSYLIINDLDFANKTIITSLGESTVIPLGTNLKPFVGYINGGGYKIKNLKVVLSDKYCGLFGKVGSNGIISSLTLENCTFTAKNDDLTKISVGAFAAENNGTIVNCHTINGTVKGSRDSNYNSDNVNKAISLYVGGLVGENNGTISYCSVKNTQVVADSKRDYSANEDTANRNTVYTGGLIACQSKYAKLNNCYVDANTSVSATGHGLCHAGFSLRRPYVDVYAGGMIGYLDNFDNTKELFADIADSKISISTRAYNDSWSGDARKTNVKTYKSQYVANKTISDSLKSKDNTQYVFPIIIDYDYSIKFMDKEGTEVPVQYSCVAEHFDYSNMVFGLTEKTTKKEYENLAYTIVANYGFNTKNVSKTEDITRKAIILVYVKEANRTFIVPVEYKVLRNSPEKLTVDHFNVRDFAQKDEIVSGNVADVLSNTQVFVVYQNGEKQAVSGSVAQAQVDCRELGLHNIDSENCGIITYENLTLKFETVVYCANHTYESKVVIQETKLQNDGTYMVSGYILKNCTNCGKQEAEYFTKLFNTQIINVIEQNCERYGYSGDRVVIDTEGFFAENGFDAEVVIEKGHQLPLLDHNYDYSNVANIDYYRDANYHYCVDCGHPEHHMFKTIENQNKVILYCEKCGYTTELEANSREKIESLPRVVVSNAYTLAGQNLVKVFVELHASTGITAANFTVGFDSRLSLVSFSLGNILNNSSSIDAFKVYKDHINVVLAQTNVEAAKDGTILELVFKTPQDATITDKYVVEILSKGGSDKFTDSNGNKTDFVAYNGKIYVVDHLPGDVNNDGRTDLFDAVIISRYIVLDQQEQIEFLNTLVAENLVVNIKYADVTLDGSIDISDVVQILRYAVGGYDQTIVANVFEVVLNYDDGSSEEHVLSVDYEFGFGTYKNLPELTREGYKFVGWFTEFGGQGDKINNGDSVKFRKEQYKQTLYAYFEPNIVHFNGNGAEGAKPDARHPDHVNFNNDDDYGTYFTKQIYVTLNGNGVFDDMSIALEQEFLGWSLSPNGEIAYTINSALDLSRSGYNGVGEITLYAVWSSVTLSPNIPTKDGYMFICWTKADKITEVWSGTEEIEIYQNTTMYAKWQKTRFTFNYVGNGGATSTNLAEYREDVVRDKDNYSTPLKTNEYARTGYIFLGWAIDKNSQTAQYEDGVTLSQEQTIGLMRYIDKYGYVNLYAVWEGITYTVVFHPNATNIKGANKDYPYQDNDITGEMLNQTLVYGTVAMLNTPTYACPDDKFIIIGWTIDVSQNEVQFPVGEEKAFNMTTYDGSQIHLYAIWRAIVSRVSYVVGGYNIVTDEICYYDSYKFRGNFQDLGSDQNGYSIYEYRRKIGENGNIDNVEFDKNTDISSWNIVGDITIECSMMYTGSAFSYTGHTVNSIGTINRKILIIPSHIASVSTTINEVGANFLANSYGLDNVEKIIIDYGITAVGENAFRQSNVEEVYMGSVYDVGRAAFYNCTNLKKVILQDGYVKMSNDAFATNSQFDIYYLGLEGHHSTNTIWGQNNLAHEYYYLLNPTEEQIAEGKYWHYEDGKIVLWTNA